MKYMSTLRILKKYLCLLVSILAITLFGTRSYAQTKNYATVTPSTGIASYNIGSDNQNSNPGNVASIDNPGNAILQPPGAPATLNARYFSLLGLGYEGEAYIQLKYGSPLTAGKTTYVRFDQPTNNGLNLDLLGLVGDLTGLFSKRIVQIDAYSGATAGSDGTIIPSTNVSATVVTDVSGKTYFAVTSSVAYNSLRIRLRVRSNALSISLGSSINMNVYPAFNYDTDNCSSSIFTSVAATGLNVSLTSLVANPQNAIDGNLNTFSQLQAGVVTLGSSVSQTIYLNGLSSATDVAKVVFSQGGSILSVNVLKTITVQAYNGNTAVGNLNSLGTLINLDLLGLFTNNTQVPVFFTPGAPFDRIKVTLDNGLAIGGNLLAGGLNIHEGQRTVPKPLFGGVTGNAQILCGGATLTLTPQNPDAGYTYNFYKKVGPNGPRTTATGVTANVLTETSLAAGVYTYYVAAQKTGCIAESDLDSVVVTVKPTLLFTATPLSNGTVGKAYTKQINPATSGTGPYTYAIAPGSALPEGLTMTSAGLISGTPTTAAVATTFSLIATDAGGCKATAAHTLTITGTLTLPASTLPNGTVNKVYPDTQLPTPTGGSTPYTYSATNLPPGVTLNPATGLLTGTPATAGTYVIPVTVTDADGNFVTTPYTIIVRSPLVLTASALSDGTNGLPYAPQIIPSATGGSGVFTYSAVNLPPGLSFDPVTRAITGTPTQSGTFTFPVTVTDNENNTTTSNYTITVRDALALGNVVFPDGAVNVVYPTQTIPDATGGTGPYTYAGLNLPPGLTFDPLTKTVSGTPTQSGTFTLSIQVTDAANRTITVPYTLKVAGALTLPTATLANGKVGAAYASPSLPAVTGGTSPYTYTIAANQLPAGLSFNSSTRVISGTPTAGGNYTITMKVTDNAGNTTSTDYALNITVDAPVVAGATVCSGNTATLTVDNLTSGVTYNFYSSTGNTPLGTGTTYTTPALTVTTTYYAEAVSGTAVSARIPVTVTVNPAPDAPTVVINSITISAGQTAILQATASSGSTIKWYAAATGGIELASGGTFTTPVLTANATYYAGTSNSFGCTSATRVPVVVNVINGTVNPNCYAATKQESGITGGLLCIGCAIFDPANSTDADLTNYTRISLPAGIGTTGYQRLIFQNPGVATDSIRLDLEIPSGLLDLSVLGGTTINVMNGTTVVSSYPLNSSLIHLSLLGGNRFKVAVAAGGVYNRVEVKVNALLSALINVYIYGADVVAPNPTIVTGNQTICSGSTATLQVAPIAGTTIVWYSAATGGTILSTENIFTTPALTATTIYYVQVSKNGCANETRLPVTVTVTTGLTPPVLATVVPVCAGLPATLSVDSPIAGITYKWYADATGGTALFTGTVFTTPALTVNTTYYVEATNGSCVSATRTAANVTVNARPVTPQITTAMTTVAQGQRVSLTGTSTESNVTFNWYTDAAATTPVFTGATYLTPPLTATTTFYLDAISTVTGCASSTRVQQTITVVPTGTPIPVGCEGPISQTNGVGGLISILARVDNPELAIDGDQQTGSTLAIPVGIGSNVYQKAVFAGLSNVGDTVRVLLNSPGQLLSLSLVPSVTVTTYQGNTSNNDGVAINNPVIDLKLLSGGTQALLTFVPAAQFDGVEVKLNSGLLGALTSINFNYAKRTATAPVVASADVTACLNATATLAVPAPQPGIIYKWYDAAGTYLGNDGATFITPAITAATKFFVEASRGGCGSSRTQVNVTISPAPSTPLLLAPSQSTCAGSSIQIKIQSPQAGVTYNWYKGGVLVPGQTTATFTDVVTANVTYEVEAVNACGTTSAKAAIAVTVGSLTPPVLTPAAVTINSGEKAVLIANSSTTGLTYHWYGADPAVTPGTPELSSLANGANGMFATDPLIATTTFYVTAEGIAGTCVSAAASVVVTVNTITPTPGSVPCEGATVAQATDVNGPALFAGVANPAFAVDDDANTSSSLFIPVGLGNSYVSQRVGFAGLSTPGDQVKVSLTQTGALLTLGIANSITVTTYKNGASNNDEKSITDPQLNLNIVTANKDFLVQFTPGTTFDAIELKLKSGVAGLLTSINLNYAQRIIAPPTVVAAAVSACEGNAAALAVSNPVAGVTYTWYDNTGAVVSNNATFNTPTTLTAGTYTYTVKATRGTCAGLVSTTVTVIITGSAPPAVPATGNPATTCLNTPVTLRVDPVTGVTYNWYDALTGGNLIASNTNSFITPSSLAVGTTTYYVEASNGNTCANTLARTPIAITINPPATAADITVTGAENSICVGSSAILTATSSLTNPVFTWFTDAALTNAVFTGAIYNVPLVTVTTNYYVTVKADGKCINAPGTGKIVTLTVNPPATAADITVSGIPASTCAGSQVTLTASSTTVTNPVFIWYKDAALTTVAQIGATFVATASTTNTLYYVTVQGTNKCKNAAADAKIVTLIVNPPATAADISVNGVPSILCSGSGATLTASSLTVVNPVFTWYTDAALMNAVFTGDVFNVPALTTTRNYYVTVTGLNKCPNLAGQALVITLNVNAPLNFAGKTLNDGSTINPYSVQIDPATGGTAPYTYALASGSVLPAGLTLSSSGLISGTPTTAGNYTFSINASDSKGCSASGVFTLNIGTTAVLSLPAATLPDGQVGTAYPVQTLPAAIGGTTPYTYVTTGLPAGLSFDPATRNITGTPTIGGMFTVTMTVTDASNRNASANYPLNVTVPAPIVADGSNCGGGRVTLVVTNAVPAITYNWFADATARIPIFTGTSFQTPAITVNTIYYVEGLAGITSTRVAVNVNLKTPASAADITITGIPSVVCGGSGASLTASSATVSNPTFKWYTDAALTNSVFTGAVYNTPVLTANTTYYVTVQGPNTCESSSATAKTVVLTVNPTLIFNGATLAGASTSTTYSAQVGSATGGTPGYTYSLQSGSTLPAGLSLSSAGLLTGTPTTAGSYAFAITATDSKGCTAVAAFVLGVGSGTQMTLPPATLPDGQVGSSYTPQTLPAAVGGTVPYTYVATGLPPGLNFNPATRVISGTPTLGGSFPVVVTVTDGNGLTATNTYTVNVTVPASAVGDAVSCGGSPVTLTVTNALTGVTYNWYNTPTGGSVLFTGPAFQTPAITATTIFYVEAISGTASSGRIAVNVTVAAALASPVVVVKSSTLSSITFGWNDVPGATSYEVSMDGGTTWTNPSSGAAGTTHLISGLPANTTVKLMVRAKGSTTCQTSAAGSVTGTATDGTVPNDVFIPNTFTPNGDGKNDIFYVYGNAIAKMRMRVYNQWGQFIFESLQQQVGWDGSFRGQIQPNGVYVYYVEVTLTDGSTDKRKGTITILR